MCLCFLDGGLCLRQGGGESDKSRLDLEEGGEGERYLDLELGGVDGEGDRRLRELSGEPRFDREGDDFLLCGDFEAFRDFLGLLLLDLYI